MEMDLEILAQIIGMHGLESIYALTRSGQWEMRVDFTKEDGSMSYIHYNEFKVGSASEEYKLTSQ